MLISSIFVETKTKIMYKQVKVSRDVYYIFKNGKKHLTLFGTEAEAKEYVNKRNKINK